MSKSSSIKEAVKRINAWRSGELDLSSLGLFEIPDELFKTKKLYASLESLGLNGNQLSSLPDTWAADQPEIALPPRQSAEQLAGVTWAADQPGIA